MPGVPLAQSSVATFHENSLLAALPYESFAALEKDLQAISLDRNRVLFDPGDLVNLVYFPKRGLVISLLVLGNDGRIVQTSMVGYEGAVGLLSALSRRRSFIRANVQIGGNCSVVRAGRFAQIANNNRAIMELITRYTEILWAESQQIVACNALHDARSRLCRWLLQTADRLGSDNATLTHELIANMLGLRRTTITLLMGSLEKKGLIRYSRGKISIVDRSLLAASACECYDAIKYLTLENETGSEFDG